jgi:hypothetical protein
MYKTEFVQTRCTVAEKRALIRIARHEQRKLSEALREIIREAAKSRGLWPEWNEENEDE